MFAEIDRFGHVRYSGLQAKYEPSIGLAAVETLIQDCRQAFANPFVHPHTHTEERIQTFYAVNGGSISDDARNHFFGSVGHPLAACCRLLDGQALLALDRWATLSRTDAIVATLHGMLIEIRYNRNIANFVLPYLDNFLKDTCPELPTERFRTEASSDYIARPVLPRVGLAQDVLKYWHDARRVNRDLDMAVGPNSEENRKKLVTHAYRYLGEVQKLAGPIECELQDFLQSLGPLAAT